VCLSCLSLSSSLQKSTCTMNAMTKKLALIREGSLHLLSVQVLLRCT